MFRFEKDTWLFKYGQPKFSLRILCIWQLATKCGYLVTAGICIRWHNVSRYSFIIRDHFYPQIQICSWKENCQKNDSCQLIKMIAVDGLVPLIVRDDYDTLDSWHFWQLTVVIFDCWKMFSHYYKLLKTPHIM